jgi:hypothetical protein
MTLPGSLMRYEKIQSAIIPHKMSKLENFNQQVSHEELFMIS